jgi:hypothetical protein
VKNPETIMDESLTLSPTAQPHVFRAADGRLLSPPDGWECLPPGDAGLTRRVKTLGPCWAVVEKRGRKSFSRGLWAPAANIAAAKAYFDAKRADPAHARRLAGAQKRRESAQAGYVEEFTRAVRAFLGFAAPFADQERRLAAVVAAHATPVGSGTVARTRQIPIDRRAEAAVVAWLRHQATGYDTMKVARVRGERRRVRRRLAESSRALLAAHRRPEPHAPEGCPLCRALGPAEPPPPA